MEVKLRFPFRLGATSYVLPADILTNVRHLAPLVDDIELILFESGDISPLPDVKLVDDLIGIAAEHGITYTVHLPLDIRLGDPDPAVRLDSIRKCIQSIEATVRLQPFAYILHCTGHDPAGPDAAWLINVGSSIDGLLAAGTPPYRLCIENLEYPFSFVEQVAESKGVSICCDLGHLRANEPSMLGNADRLLKRCRVVHLHGIARGRDHQAVTVADCIAYSVVLSSLLDNTTERVITLEIFNRTGLEQSLSAIKEHIQCQK